MRIFAVTLISALWMLPLFSSAETGSITGIVVGEGGNPVAGAKVYVMEAHRPFQGAMTYFDTNDQGLFEISGLPFGEYKVFAKKEKENYPDMGKAFYSNHVFPTAVVSEGNPTPHVVVQLPPKAGTIEGSVIDAVTLKPVNPTLLLKRASDPKNFLAGGASSKYRILVPSDAPVTLEIRARGYIPWRYPGKLHLKPNEAIRLDVQLQPIH